MRHSFGLAAGLLLLVSGAWAQGAQFTIAGYDIDGNTLLTEHEITQILARHIGPQRSLDDINQAAEDLRKAYEAAGYPIVKVFPPTQTAENGRVRLKVIEGRIQRIRVKGNQSFDESNIRASLPPLQESTAPHAPSIIAAIAAANENPAKQAAVNFQSGDAPGQVEAIVNVNEEQPQKFTFGYDNMGSPSTGINRAMVGYQNANLFNRDHIVTAQLGTSLDYPSKSQTFTSGYRIPFYGRNLSFDLVGAVSRATSTLGIGFGGADFVGRGYVIGARLNQSLSSAGEYRHRLIYGFDFKDFNNTCTGFAAGRCGTVTAMPLSLTYYGQYNAPAVQANAALGFHHNIAGGPHGSQEHYEIARTDATADWRAWRFVGNVAVPLPADFKLRSALSAQSSPDRLIPGEQFGIGGANTVRGYAERTLAGDKGYAINLEAYSPDFGKYLNSSFNARLLVFQDYGRVADNNLTTPVNQPRRTLASYGVGLRLNWTRDASLRFDIGVPQKAYITLPGNNATRERGDTYAHAALNVQF